MRCMQEVTWGLWHIKQTETGYLAWRFTGDGTLRITARTMEEILDAITL